MRGICLKHFPSTGDSSAPANIKPQYPVFRQKTPFRQDYIEMLLYFLRMLLLSGVQLHVDIILTGFGKPYVWCGCIY